MKKFPIDCTRNCPHFCCWDMSIDDYTNVCSLLNMKIDDCDVGFPQSIFLPICPLEESGENKIGERREGE